MLFTWVPLRPPPEPTLLHMTPGSIKENLSRFMRPYALHQCNKLLAAPSTDTLSKLCCPNVTSCVMFQTINSPTMIFLRCFSLSKVWIDPYLYDQLHCTFPVTYVWLPLAAHLFPLGEHIYGPEINAVVITCFDIFMCVLCAVRGCCRCAAFYWFASSEMCRAVL
jgi:hypothetical protein